MMFAKTKTKNRERWEAAPLFFPLMPVQSKPLGISNQCCQTGPKFRPQNLKESLVKILAAVFYTFYPPKSALNKANFLNKFFFHLGI
jgi:hypothetical protein